MNAGLSRRSVLKGIAASLAVAALGQVDPAFAQAPAKSILLRNVKIFNGIDSRLIEGNGVLIEGNLIKALVGAADAVADAQVID